MSVSTFSNGSALVQVFHETYGQPVRTVKAFDVPERKMRMDLIQEEYNELAHAQNENDFVEVVDAWADLVYVIYGAGKTHGVDLDAVILNAKLTAHDKNDLFVVRTVPSLYVPERAALMELLRVEYNRLTDAYNRGDIDSMATAWVGLIYAVYGAALTHGVDLNAVLLEVQRSNLSKLGTDEDGNKIVLRREDGKILKGPDFSLPDIKQELVNQGWSE